MDKLNQAKDEIAKELGYGNMETYLSENWTHENVLDKVAIRYNELCNELVEENRIKITDEILYSIGFEYDEINSEHDIHYFEYVKDEDNVLYLVRYSNESHYELEDFDTKYIYFDELKLLMKLLLNIEIKLSNKQI